VKELHKRFCEQVFGFAIVKKQFENIMSFKHGMTAHCPLGKLFDILDNDHDGNDFYLLILIMCLYSIVVQGELMA